MLGLDAHAVVAELDGTGGRALIRTDSQRAACGIAWQALNAEVEERLPQHRRIPVDRRTCLGIHVELDAGSLGFGTDDRHDFVEQRSKTGPVAASGPRAG